MINTSTVELMRDREFFRFCLWLGAGASSGKGMFSMHVLGLNELLKSCTKRL